MYIYIFNVIIILVYGKEVCARFIFDLLKKINLKHMVMLKQKNYNIQNKQQLKQQSRTRF